MDQISSIFRNFKKGQLWAFQFSLDLEVFRIPKGSPGTKEVFFCVNQIVWVLSWAAYRMKWDLRICLSFGPFWRSERRLLHIIPVPLHNHCCLHTRQLESFSYLQSEERAYPNPDLGLTNSERKDYSRPQGSFTLLSLAWNLLLPPAFWSPVCPFLDIKVASFFILRSHF